MDNLLFQDNSRIYNINLSREAYEQMLHYCNESNPYETGGILIGNYSLDQTTANILQITPPPKNSKHAKCKFYRSSSGLKKILDAAWNQGQYYLGEWHYHPNALSFPSSTDKTQMMNLSQNKQLNCPEPILIIIGGYKDNWNINVRLYVNNQEITMNKQEKPAFKDERITKLIPRSIPRGQETDFVVKALEFYNRHLQRQRSQER